MTIFIYAAYLTIYIIVMLGIGIYHALKIKTVEDYLVAGRKVGFWNTVGTIVATSCGAVTFIGFVSCLVVMIVVSLMTKHASDEQVKAAYFEDLTRQA